MATRTNETNQLGGPGRTSNQGRKEASGSEQEQVGDKASENGGRKASSTTSRGGAKIVALKVKARKITRPQKMNEWRPALPGL